MPIQITGKRVGPFGRDHEAITHYRWEEDGTGAGGITEKPTVVQWLDSGRTTAYVAGPPRVDVGVNSSPSGARWLQTHADRVWTNNIMALPDV